MPAGRTAPEDTMRSIREPGAAPREPRPSRAPRAASPAVDPPRPGRLATPDPARAVRSRPDANPVRLMIGLAGLASAAAFTTAMLPSVTPAPAADPALEPLAVAAAQPTPEPSVLHVTRYVQLKPGETAPPTSTVLVQPKPTPRITVKVVTSTKQSGKP